MSAVPAWKWFFAALLVAGSAFCSGTETALTALGDAKARQLRDRAGRRERMLGLWVDHPERVLSTLLIGNTLMSVGAGALAAELGSDLSGLTGLTPATALALCATAMTAAVLFLGEIAPKMLAKRYPERVALASIPVVRVLCFLLWPLSQGVTRLTSGLLGRLGAGEGSPAVTGEEIEYLIEMGTREGVLDEVKEELLNSVLEFADRVAKEIMVPRTRMVGISRDLPEAELIRVITENPYSRMPVFAGTMDEVVGDPHRARDRGRASPREAHRALPAPEARLLRPRGDEGLEAPQGDAAKADPPRHRGGRVRRHERPGDPGGRAGGDRRRSRTRPTSRQRR